MADVRRWFLLDVDGVSGGDARTLPLAESRRALIVGDKVRVTVLYDRPLDDGARLERLWIDVTAVAGARYAGVVASRTRHLETLQAGDRIDFGPEHVGEILPRPGDEGWEDMRRLVLVSAALDGRVRPELVWREPGRDAYDSGWRAVGPGEGRDALHPPVKWSVQRLLQRELRLISIVALPVGTEARWDARLERFVVPSEVGGRA